MKTLECEWQPSNNHGNKEKGIGVILLFGSLRSGSQTIVLLNFYLPLIVWKSTLYSFISKALAAGAH